MRKRNKWGKGRVCDLLVSILFLGSLFMDISFIILVKSLQKQPTAYVYQYRTEIKLIINEHLIN